MPNKIENKMTYEETLERATMTPREEEFRKILGKGFAWDMASARMFCTTSGQSLPI